MQPKRWHACVTGVGIHRVVRAGAVGPVRADTLAVLVSVSRLHRALAAARQRRTATLSGDARATTSEPRCP